MAQPAAIWSTRLIMFDGEVDATQNVILSQARNALHALIARIDQLHQLVGQDNLIEGLYTDPAIPGILSDLCAQQGLAETILFSENKRGSKESLLAFSKRKERVAHVQKLCGILPLPILKDRDLRNSLTHIDEKLPDELAAHDKTGWFIDVAVEKRGAFAGMLGNQLNSPSGLSPPGLEVRYCRSYIASEDVILHFDHEVSLDKLRQEANIVLGAVFGESPHPVPQMPPRSPPLTRAVPLKVPGK
jgi:hypothetical protein